MGITGGDAVRQLLAEISERAEIASALLEALPGTARSDGAAWDSAADVWPLVAALTAVLDLHKPTKIATVGGTDQCCDECRNVPILHSDVGWPCPTYRAVAAALEEQS